MVTNEEAKDCLCPLTLARIQTPAARCSCVGAQCMGWRKSGIKDGTDANELCYCGFAGTPVSLIKGASIEAGRAILDRKEDHAA